MDQTTDNSLPATYEHEHPLLTDVDEHEHSPLTHVVDHGSPPPTDDGDNKGVAILLVGSKNVDKRGVVDYLMMNGTWEDSRTAVDSLGNGVRILTRTSPARPARVIVDTTPLKDVKGRSPVAIARRWISRNYLRRILYGKDVFVVCVVTSRVREICTVDMFSYSSCWVDVFGLIFQDHKPAIMVLVRTESTENVTLRTKEEMARFVQDHGLSPANITYSNLQGGDDSVSTIIEESIRQRRSHQERKQHWIGISSIKKDAEKLDMAQAGRRPPLWKSCWQPSPGRPDIHYAHGTVTPFTINEALSEKFDALSQKEKFKQYEALSDREKFGPWGPERVILFGRTGSGKSTLAQMLTLGKLDMDNETFEPSSGVRGGTKGVQAGVGRGWYVLDTPGFGEPKDDFSTITTSQVELKIKDYVRWVEGTFSHYLYVVKKDRLDLLEERLWKFFTALFGQEIEKQFTVVVSNADEAWVWENITTLREVFTGCDSFVSAEFPPIDKNDEVVENEYQEMRTESLSELEERLASLNRCDMFCKYGKWAKTNIRMESERAALDLGLEKNERIRFLVRGASMIFACCNITQRPFSELTQLLRVNDKFSLIPE
ncbi:unnamed protein product [Calypogeia fissa]